MRRPGQIYGPIFGEDNDVFGADAELVLKVDARFEGQGHPGFEWDFRSTLREGRGGVVGFKPDVMPEAVGEDLAVTGVGDDLARDLVEFPVGPAHGGGPKRCFQSRADEMVNVAHVLGGPAKADRAGHVRGIALMDHPEIDEKYLVFANHRVVGKVVNFPAIGPGGHDGVERKGIDVFPVGHFGEQETLDASFGHVGADLRKDGGQDGFVDPLGLRHECHLGR